MIVNKWSDLKKKTIRELLEMGNSYSQIAIIMKTTRSAIAGIAWRMKKK